MNEHRLKKEPGPGYPMTTLGVILGAGLGTAVGVLVGGGPGIAIGASIGAGIGVALGAALDTPGRRRGR